MSTEDTAAWDLLIALGAEVSPDLDAYASGELDASQVRCALCKHAPCVCQRCSVHDMASCGCDG